MADYRPQFRPVYTFSTDSSGKASLVDRIKGSINRVNDSVYETFSALSHKEWNQTIDDYVVTRKNTIAWLKNDIKEHYPTYGAMIFGMSSSILGNQLGAESATEKGYSNTLIEWISYGWELGFHVGISGGVYTLLAMLKGDSLKKISRDLVELTIVTTPIQLGPYAFGRNMIADDLISQGMIPEKATVSAQLWLLGPYVLTAKYTAKSLVPRLETYLKKKNILRNGNNGDMSKSIGAKTDFQKDVKSNVKPGNMTSNVEFIEKAV